MSRAPFHVALLDAAYDRTGFKSSSEPLDRYFREQVTQDARRQVAVCFVALADRKTIAGYYTLASTSLLLADLPANTGKKLPRYPTVSNPAKCHFLRFASPGVRQDLPGPVVMNFQKR